MTPKQREILVTIRREITAMSQALARLEHRISQFEECVEPSATYEIEAFIPEEIERFLVTKLRLCDQ